MPRPDVDLKYLFIFNSEAGSRPRWVLASNLAKPGALLGLESMARRKHFLSPAIALIRQSNKVPRIFQDLREIREILQMQLFHRKSRFPESDRLLLDAALEVSFQ